MRVAMFGLYTMIGAVFSLVITMPLGIDLISGFIFFAGLALLWAGSIGGAIFRITKWTRIKLRLR